MVDDGRLFMSKRFLELNKQFPGQISMDEYSDKLVIHDMAKGLLELPSFSMYHVDDYLLNLKKQSNGDPYEFINRLKNIDHIYEVKYSLEKVSAYQQ